MTDNTIPGQADIAVAIAAAKRKHPKFACSLSQGLLIIGEEYGEAVKEFNDNNRQMSDSLRRETLDLIVTAVRFLEYIDSDDAKADETIQKKHYLAGVIEKHRLWLNGEPGGERANLVDAKLAEADLRNVDLSGANMDRANLAWSNLSGANLSEAYLRGAYLRGADLRGAELYGANLSCADLSNADLRGANLRGANMHGANLTGADLREAYLVDVDFWEAEIDGATFEGAQFAPAPIRGDLAAIIKFGRAIK